MNSTDSHVPRRSALILIALFSCLQILIGFFLITGNSTVESPYVMAKAEQTIKISQVIDWGKL